MYDIWNCLTLLYYLFLKAFALSHLSMCNSELPVIDKILSLAPASFSSCALLTYLLIVHWELMELPCVIQTNKVLTVPGPVHTPLMPRLPIFYKSILSPMKSMIWNPNKLLSLWGKLPDPFSRMIHLFLCSLEARVFLHSINYKNAENKNLLYHWFSFYTAIYFQYLVHTYNRRWLNSSLNLIIWYHYSIKKDVNFS